MRIFLLIACFLVSAVSSANTQFKSLNDDFIDFERAGWSHLIFIDIWASYGGYGPEVLVKTLPDTFNQQVKQVWIQPILNVTLKDVLEYQDNYKDSRPIVLDKTYSIFRRYDIWETPAHVVIHNGAVKYSGDGVGLIEFIKTQTFKTEDL